jgi:hypothetical protein
MTMRVCLFLACTVLFTSGTFAQEIEAKLSGNKTGQGFTVKNNSGLPLFTVRGDGNVGIGTTTPDFTLRLDDGGILATGGYNTGTTVPVLPSGAGFLWYPKKGALRSGYQEPSYTTDTEVGATSIGCGFKPHASGSSCVALGYQPKATEDYATAIGTNAEASGRGAMAIGTAVTASGEYSTAMGRYTSTNGKDGTFMIGDLNASAIMNASTTNRFYARFENGYVLYTKSDRSTGVFALNGATSWSSVSDSTRKENFLAADAEAMLSDFRSLRLGSWNYIGDDQRHYGPMAQEWFAAFGRDGIGRIGDDTTLASADVDGVLCIAVKALEQRTTELRSAVEELRSTQKLLSDAQEKISAHQKELHAAVSELSATREELRALRGIVHAMTASIRSLQQQVEERSVTDTQHTSHSLSLPED